MTFAFEEMELDPATAELRRAGARVPVEPQVFEVLAYLVAHRDRVVPKEELMDNVWGGRFVSESAVTSRIKQARQAVGDNGQAQRLIRTLHGKGYRFVGPVREGRPTAAPPREAPVRYAESDGLEIAYQITGGGPRDLVLVAGFVSHLELDWADPRHAAFLDRLGTFGRLIRFDKRGTGLSDRPHDVPDLETRMHDLDEAMASWWGRRARAAATPSTVRALIAMNTLVDVRDALGSIRVPTLVMHRRGDQDSRVDEGRYLAEHIAGARFVELPGADHFVAIDAHQILDPIEDFLAGLASAPAPETALGAVLAVAGPLPRLSASRIVHTPDGATVAIYDGPATAIRDVLAARAGDSRFGLHIAEVPRTGAVVDGPGVAAAQELARRAEPGRLLVSATVRDLVAGSGIALTEAGDGAYRPALPG